MSPNPALDNVLVVSVGHTLPGLYCLAMLRDLGARAICIERPAPPAADEKYKGMDVTFPIRSLTLGTDEMHLDLKQESGVRAFRQLAQCADVVLEGFRPGVMQRLGIDYTSLHELNPGLVYAAITGYGQEGVWRDRVGHDINYLAETGVLALGNPVGLPGATWADGMAGVSAALNIVAAIHARSASGRGQMIDCAIVDGPLSLMTSEFEYAWNTGNARGAGATHLTGSHPWYGIYPTRDGKQVAIGSVEPAFYQVLCHALGLPELATQQYVQGKALEETKAKLGAAIASRSRDEVLALFREHQACVSPVLGTAEVLASPLATRAIARDPVTGQSRVLNPVRLAAAPTPTREPLADFLLARGGFTKNEIEQLLAAGIMGDP